MVDASTERALWVWTAPELITLVAAAGVLIASLTGHTTLWTSISRPLRLAALAVILIQLSIPVWVFYDIRRRSDDPGMLWVHAAAMPLLNIFGLAAYMSDRRQAQE